MPRPKLKDIQSYTYSDLQHMSMSELRRVASAAAQYANTRLTNLEKAGIAETSPAYQAVYGEYKNKRKKAKKSKKWRNGKFSTQNLKTRNQIMQELTRARLFLDDKTSTVTGARKLQSNVEKRLQIGAISQAGQTKIWRAYNRIIKERGSAWYSLLGSTRVQQIVAGVYNSNKRMGVNQLYEAASKAVEQAYKNEFARRGNRGSVWMPGQ